MRRPLLASGSIALTGLILGGCGGAPAAKQESAAARKALRADVVKVHRAALEHSPAAASSALQALRADVNAFEASGQLPKAKADQVLAAVSGVQAVLTMLTTTTSSPTTSSTTTTPSTTTSTTPTTAPKPTQPPQTTPTTAPKPKGPPPGHGPGGPPGHHH